MSTPAIDILVPVWNNPFETRACLAAILEHSPDARLIIVANGSSRETELMLEEFSEPLGDRALFLLSDRNLGLVPALNRGLARSDSDYVVIVRPNVMVCQGWLDKLLKAAETPGAGIVTPLFYGEGMPDITAPVRGCSLIETCSLSFSTLLLKGEMRMILGSFNENLDGGAWCLYDYLRRAEEHGYRAYCNAQLKLFCGADNFFGSPERRQVIAALSKKTMEERWGTTNGLCIYCGRETTADDMGALLEWLLHLSRRGNKSTLLLHRSQYRECIKRGWNGLHTGVTLKQLSLFGAERDVIRIHGEMRTIDPNLVVLRGVQTVPFPGVTDAAYWEDLPVT